ncbi:hypothetical protein [Teichococcus wenyumeiae]|uniref:hypothetical protein n=1 Tax=Teichococcus wenyumeiae TaxID=2478470 RepID=UPI0011C3F6DB|nr:hypothetical protein [Pseudoroseomonas wenyumeiae]
MTGVPHYDIVARINFEKTDTKLAAHNERREQAGPNETDNTKMVDPARNTTQKSVPDYFIR